MAADETDRVLWLRQRSCTHSLRQRLADVRLQEVRVHRDVSHRREKKDQPATVGPTIAPPAEPTARSGQKVYCFSRWRLIHWLFPQEGNRAVNLASCEMGILEKIKDIGAFSSTASGCFLLVHQPNPAGSVPHVHLGCLR